MLDIIFPRKSLTGVSGSWITEKEMALLASNPVIEEKSELESRDIHHIDSIVALTQYGKNPLIQKAIHTFKYKRIPTLGTSLASLFIEITPTYHSSSVLCPVPLHWTREFQRGFNQSAVLAQSLAEKTGLQQACLLKRVRSTGHQAWRTKHDRLHALHNAFQCSANTVPHTVILVDDLVTTGATLDACAQVLKNAGVQKVDAWVIARA